jgi:L-asparaginase
LARKYGLEMVEPSYFFTQKRWDEHITALEREKQGTGLSTWSADEYLPQGTVGAIALDEDGVVCCATSTGGLTNKLTGRIGDTPTVGAGFWAEEWVEDGDPTGVSQDKGLFQRMLDYSMQRGPVVSFSESFQGLIADCLPTRFSYTPVLNGERRKKWTTRSIAFSGTGNGDSFLRVGAARTAGAIARFARLPGSVAVSRVSGPGGELQISAGSRWGRTGEGEGGLIGIECVVVRDEAGRCIETRSEILQDFNCNGMFRTWIDDDGKVQIRVWRDDEE